MDSGPGAAMIEATAVASGTEAARPFSPGVPIQPVEGYSRTPRAHDYITGYNIAARPRRNERVAFETLRGLIEAYDIAQICIWHRINSVRSLQWNLVAAPWEKGNDISKWVDIGMAALYRPDRRSRFKPWLAKYLYDVLAYDAGSLYRMRNNAGRAIGLKVVDGTTIAPLLDYYGDIPMAEMPGEDQPAAYVQYAQGVPWNWLTVDDLIYEPFQPTSNTPYGKAPIETILLNANTDLRFQAYFLQRFTEGNIPEAFASAPETWSPAQIEEFQAAWDALILGDQAAKSQIKWIPGGGKIEWSNDKPFDDAFSLFLMRKTAAAFHIVPSDLGFTEDVNRATSETQVDTQFRIGDLPLIEHVQGILDAFLQEDLGLPLCFQFDTGQEKEDRLQTAQADKIYIESGVVSASEVRENVYGLSEPNGQPVPRFIFSTRAGPIPLSALYAVAGQVDVDSAAPLPGAQLPHKPFALVEGVAPQEPPKAPPLAVERYPEENQASAQAALADANAPVVKAGGTGVYVYDVLNARIAKDGAAAGLTTVNSPASYDLIGDDEDDDDKDEVAKAAELASFKRFTKARRRDGKWRDFQFTATPDVQAHRLNQAGRGAVRKAAGQLVAAGLVVRAADTGRVLMLQRAMDGVDPAGGTWEFPGGCLEEGETALSAACREWQEEVGCLLPVDSLAGLAGVDGATVGSTWAAANGVYQGFIVTVPTEASIPLGTRGQVSNPDDPDGDVVEAVAWWDPQTLMGNPVVRAELSADLGLVLEALQPSEVVGDPKVLKASSWRDSADKTPQHSYDLRLTDYYAPRITDALQAAFPESKLRAAIESLAGSVAKSVDPDLSALRDAARAALGSSTDTASLETALRQVWADAYQAGSFAAGQQVGGAAITTAGVSAIDWSTWTPGDPADALQAADGGLGRLLEQAGITIDGITGSSLDQLGNALADGLTAGSSVDTIAASLSGIVSDPSRAEMIAHTESARAVTQATLETYGLNGIGQWDWVLSDDACPECEDAASNNPHPLDDTDQPPLHPRCRCAASPVVDSVTATGDQTNGDMGALGGMLGDLASDASLTEEASAAVDVGSAVAEDLATLSDDDLAESMATADEAQLDKILEELERRDTAAQDEAKKAEKNAKAKERRDAKQAAAEAEKESQYDALINSGTDPDEAFTQVYGEATDAQRKADAIAQLRANGYSGKGFDELSQNMFQDEADRMYWVAEGDTNGFMVNKAGKSAGIDPRSLFTGPESRARKYASDELLEFWQQHGRITVDDVRAGLLGGKSRMASTGYWR